MARRTVASRVLALLAAFDDDHRRLGLTALAHRAGLPVPTAHRLLAELSEWGAVTRMADGDYVVGRRLWDLGHLAPQPTVLREAASPFLSDVHATTRATVHLAVRDGRSALYVDRLTGSASVPIVSTVGSRLPLHCTGVGKVLLAHAPPEVCRAVLADLGPPPTPYTLVQPGRLEQQLRRVRRDGHATTAEEMSAGACSIAVPVRAGTDVVAALGVVVPDLRRGRASLLAALEVAARGIGRRLPVDART